MSNSGLKKDEITTWDTLRILIAIKREDGAPKDIRGGTFRASIGTEDTRLTGTVTVLDGVKGLVQVDFPRVNILEGQAIANLIVTLAGETQTVWRRRYQVFQEYELLRRSGG